MPRGRPRTFDRDDAVEKAMMLFWDKGFINTSLSDLTTTLGINPPSFYAAFGSKEALYREVLNRYRTEIAEKIWGVLLRGKSAREAVEKMLSNTASYLTRKQFPRGCLLSMAGLDGGLSEVLEAELRLRRNEMYMRLKNCLIIAQERGEIAAGVDCESVTQFYFTVQQGMAARSRDGETADALQNIVISAISVWPFLTHPAS
ncbi:TetR/AcrR family transcriptional regulator [Brenneria goodwinii]|uniref:TetR/AcrR family transcriptional regulator n=1 Tax=Brenneria goodwinii TaxID=1109412 RepID=UPI000EF1EB6A|nr:TetR/AcrR family transcriptional regulator [Brenneria goodwinii]MCG8155415.1 TetR/AcrR family transcriptional regulator [Brenneria goodwinii]MCG8161615.1 TetR/AcrR family transcriptional regulator [Brenneria goodwinii]MCG8166038.1 TetR/AcrR family transcriptional regulator [Brenneria goodwinii]MCG8169262.1 TetR/AcrR family transcriptional regulator [Brenneria goodwinii]MCG8175734.1 TetR/AcrR family transcriptional regulator [Brenneria goodwinii]